MRAKIPPMNLVCETEIECPHCGEAFAICVDTSQGDASMIEDCTVCCRPIQFFVRCEPGEVLSLEISVA
jgi:Cysteine-rich CPXCG